MVYAPKSVGDEWWNDPERREAIYAQVAREQRRGRIVGSLIGGAIAIYLLFAVWQMTHDDATGKDCYQDFDGFGNATICENEPRDY